MTEFPHTPLIGASIPCGPRAVDDFIRLKLGNVVLLKLPREREAALEVVKKCRDAGIFFTLSELNDRGFWRRRSDAPSREVLEEALEAAGGFFIGRYTICETGGILYWPRGYTLGGESPLPAMPPAETLSEAKKFFIDYLKRYIAFERGEIGGGALIGGDSALVLDYHAEAGVDSLCLEMLPGNSLLMLASARGAARAWKKCWGVHIAMGWYGGVRVDELWLKRWKMAICTAYAAGADYLYPETGHYGFSLPGAPPLDFAAPEMRRVRHELRRLYRMSMIHRRPEGGPRVAVALLHGRYDGSPALWNPFAWGQYGDGWESTGEERSWELADVFHRRSDAFCRTETGKVSVSGNPPYGTFDVLSADAPQEAFDRYRAIILLGPNRMDDTLYGKLCRYAASGGHLLLSLAHCSVTDRRDGAPELFRGGDLRELCGFRVSEVLPEAVMGVKFCRPSRFAGYDYPFSSITIDPFWIGRRSTVKITDPAPGLRICAALSETYDDTMEKLDAMPLLVEHAFGAGRVLTVTSVTAPGAEGMREFYAVLLRCISAGERGADDLLAPEGVRYAVYGDERHRIFYIVNTVFDFSQPVRPPSSAGSGGEFPVPAGDFRALHLLSGILAVMPELPESQVTAASPEEIVIHAPEKQRVLCENVGDRLLHPSVNGIRFALAPGERREVSLDRRVPDDPALHRFYAPDFLVEPEMHGIATRMPY